MKCKSCGSEKMSETPERSAKEEGTKRWTCQDCGAVTLETTAKRESSESASRKLLG